MVEYQILVDSPPTTTLPKELDGSLGLNRSRGGIQQIAANTDMDAVRTWLAEYSDSPHTLRSYRKEAGRLLMWSLRVLGKPLSSLTREDLLVYETFLANPSTEWMDSSRSRRGGERRFFDGPLSPRSVRQALGILSGLFGYLVAAGYLAGNPLALRRQRGEARLRGQTTMERYLDRDLWQSVLDYIEALPQETLRDKQHYERVRWLFRLLYGASLRVSEAAKASAGDLVLRRGKWWLHVVGKGGHKGDVPISEGLMADFSRYRRFHSLPVTPVSCEKTPLVMSITGNTEKFLTSTAIYLIVKEIFRRMATEIATTNPSGAATLRKASTHWLRHTSATHQADAGNDIRFIQKNLRHASIETTAIYLHAEDDLRHEKTTQ